MHGAHGPSTGTLKQPLGSYLQRIYMHWRQRAQVKGDMSALNIEGQRDEYAVHLEETPVSAAGPPALPWLPGGECPTRYRNLWAEILTGCHRPAIVLTFCINWKQKNIPKSRGCTILFFLRWICLQLRTIYEVQICLQQACEVSEATVPHLDASDTSQRTDLCHSYMQIQPSHTSPHA